MNMQKRQFLRCLFFSVLSYQFDIPGQPNRDYPFFLIAYIIVKKEWIVVTVQYGEDIMSKTKEELALALKRVVCRKSFSKTTITDITKELGMSRENFYYHFHDKYELLKWQCKHDLINPLADNCAIKSKDELCTILISLIKADDKYYHCLVKDLDKNTIKYFIYPYLKPIVSLYVGRSMNPSVWKMRREKEDFVADFFTDALINYFIDYLYDHESIAAPALERNFLFLFREFLTA